MLSQRNIAVLSFIIDHIFIVIMESLIFLEIEEIENTGEIIVPGNKCLMIRSNKNIVKGVNFVWNLGLFIGNIAAGD